MASSILQVPFAMTLKEHRETATSAGVRAIQRMRESAQQAGISDLSLEEINAEIAVSRKERILQNPERV